MLRAQQKMTGVPLNVLLSFLCAAYMPRTKMKNTPIDEAYTQCSAIKVLMGNRLETGSRLAKNQKIKKVMYFFLLRRRTPTYSKKTTATHERKVHGSKNDLLTLVVRSI